MQTRREFLGSALLAAAAVSTCHADQPTGWQIGCYTRPWAKYELKEALDGIAAAGFKYAGLMTAKGGNVITLKTTLEQAAAIADQVKQRGMQVISIWGGGFPTENADGLKRLIDNSAACGCPNLLLGGTDEKHADAYYKIVAECCDYAASKNVGLSVKPHGGNNASGAQCRRLIEKVGHPNFRLWYDAGNVFFYSGGTLDPVDDAAKVDGLVVGMAVKDFLPPKDVNMTPGTGKVDFPNVMARLKAGGFTHGALVVECLTGSDLATVNAEAVKARQFVQTLV